MLKAIAPLAHSTYSQNPKVFSPTFKVLFNSTQCHSHPTSGCSSPTLSLCLQSTHCPRTLRAALQEAQSPPTLLGTPGSARATGGKGDVGLSPQDV